MKNDNEEDEYIEDCYGRVDVLFIGQFESNAYAIAAANNPVNLNEAAHC